MLNLQGLTKRYRGEAVVQDVTFHCPPGTVTGFLGPNGAGKSTTLRMLAGLSTPDTGTATVAGSRYRDLPNPGRVAGVMLDADAQHKGRSGRETLRLAALTMGCDTARVEEVLSLVGLGGKAARKRVGGYSLGMKQRLGIAHALLGTPEILVLDEPANGLDPAGIRWMRGLLRDYAAAGGTILLSSHLLREVASVADRLVVISGGRIVAAGDTRDLLGGQDDIEEYYFRLTEGTAPAAADMTGVAR